MQLWVLSVNMKYIFYPLIIASVLVSILVYLAVSISKVYFKFDLSGISIGNLTSGSKINLKINSYIENLNKFKINFSGLFVQLFYNNDLIAASTDVNTNKYTVPANGKFNFQEDIDLFINKASLLLVKNIAINKIANKPTTIEYHVRVKLFNISIPVIKDSFTI